MQRLSVYSELSCVSTAELRVAGTHQQVTALTAEKQSLQDKLNQHLETSQASTSASHTELTSLRDRASIAEAALTDAQTKVQRLSEEAEQARQEKAQAEQHAGDAKAVEGQLEVEVARLQQQLDSVQGQLQVAAFSCNSLLTAPVCSAWCLGQHPFWRFRKTALCITPGLLYRSMVLSRWLSEPTASV